MHKENTGIFLIEFRMFNSGGGAGIDPKASREKAAAVAAELKSMKHLEAMEQLGK